MSATERRLQSPVAAPGASTVLEMDAVDVIVPTGRAGSASEQKMLLSDVSWTVRAGEHWAVLGPNGAGKSTLLSLTAARRQPSRGTVTVLGGRLGRVDIRSLHQRIGLVDTRFLPPDFLDVLTVVLTGLSGTIQPRYEAYGADAGASARRALSLVDALALTERRFGTLSRGERARVMIARALSGDPQLLLLDEPAVGLDLPGREDLLGALLRLSEENVSRVTVMVAHLLEELPQSVTHALLLSESRVVARGPVEEVLTEDHLSSCFGRRVRVHRREGRWSAVATSG